jgi:hypothetical protein
MCLDMDRKKRIAKACDPVAGKIATTTLKICGIKRVELSVAFPGCDTDDLGELTTCLKHAIECELCLGLSEADDLPHDCDQFDDALINGSCL